MSSIFQSFNLLIRNLVIRESPNQLINQSRRHRRAAGIFAPASSSFACCRAMVRAPNTQTSRGGGSQPPPQAFIGFRSSARQRYRKALAAQGNLGCERVDKLAEEGAAIRTQ